MQPDQLPWPMQAALIIAVALLFHGVARLLWAFEEWLCRYHAPDAGDKQASIAPEVQAQRGQREADGDE